MKTAFVFNLPRSITTEMLRDIFSRFGRIVSVRVVKNFGEPRGYGFVEFSTTFELLSCIWGTERNGIKILVDEGKISHTIYADFERNVLMEGWKPRRVGGGLGGKKESGQLRFGGVRRPFKVPSDIYDDGLKRRLSKSPIPTKLRYASYDKRNYKRRGRLERNRKRKISKHLRRDDDGHSKRRKR